MNDIIIQNVSQTFIIIQNSFYVVVGYSKRDYIRVVMRNSDFFEIFLGEGYDFFSLSSLTWWFFRLISRAVGGWGATVNGTDGAYYRSVVIFSGGDFCLYWPRMVGSSSVKSRLISSMDEGFNFIFKL